MPYIVNLEKLSKCNGRLGSENYTRGMPDKDCDLLTNRHFAAHFSVCLPVSSVGINAVSECGRRRGVCEMAPAVPHDRLSGDSGTHPPHAYEGSVPPPRVSSTTY